MRIAVCLLIAGAALPAFSPLRSQDKPRVFIAPNSAKRTEGYRNPYSTQRTTTIEDRTIEMSHDFAESCKEVTVSAERRKADYIVRLNRKVGRSQIAVYQRNGDLVGVAEKSSVSAAVKEACELIKKDQTQAGGPAANSSEPSASTK